MRSPLDEIREARDGADRAAHGLAQHLASFIEQGQGGDERAGAFVLGGAGDDERAVGRHRELLDTRRPERRERDPAGGAIDMGAQEALLDVLAVNRDHVGVCRRRDTRFLGDGLCCERQQAKRGEYQAV
jgi:hypothetical protein